MCKSKYKKILIACFTIIFVVMSIETGIFAGDRLHTEHCNIQNCSLCNLIQIASCFKENMIVLFAGIFILRVLISPAHQANKKNDVIEKQTLIKLKVIQNK